MKNRNQDFIEAVANDRELHEFLSTPAIGKEAAQLETLACLGDYVDIGGYDYPAHTLGTYATLAALEHPFAKPGGKHNGFDIIIALYLLLEREKSIPLFRRYLKRIITKDQLMEKIFSVPYFAAIDIAEAENDLFEILNYSGGFAMIPQNGAKGTSGAGGTFDVEYISSIAAFVMNTYPSLTLFELTWRIPYPMLGYLVLQVMRRNGVKGLGTGVKEDEAWRRFKALTEQYGHGK